MAQVGDHFFTGKPVVADPNKNLRQHLDGRLAGMRTARYSFWQHWQELATYIFPRRYKWLVTPNQFNRGSPINGAIIDSTGTISARTLAAGMMSGITSPTRPWFKLKIEGFDNSVTNEVSLWLEEVEKRMTRVFAESNFYNAMGVMYHDLVVFGTAIMLIDEDFQDVIRCYNPCAGEYYCENSDRMFVDTIARELILTVIATVQWFGKKNCSETVQKLYDQGGAGWSQEVAICHMIEPNMPAYPALPSKWKYRSVYWERGNPSNKEGAPAFLQVRGYHEYPAIAPRWDIVSNDAYGRSPAMDALGDIKQLQHEQKRKAQAIDKMVNPPLIADIQMKNQPASTVPGGITYGILSGGSDGMKPIYQVTPQIAEMMQDIGQVQLRIRDIFYNDLFMMISQLQTVRTATEIDARREEKLIMLGPVLERFENEALDPMIDRVFNIMNRAGLLPPAPEEIQNRELQVTYVSMLQVAQKAAATGGMERMLQVVGGIAAINPDTLDTINWDQFINTYGQNIEIAPSVMNSPEQIEAIRQAKLQQKQAQDALAAAPVAADSAKLLSETDVGGGKNALQAMLGTESVAA